MKFWSFLFGMMILLSGCSSQTPEEKMTLDVCETYQNIQTLSGEATITTDYGQRVYEYDVAFCYDFDEGFVIEIVNPKILSGIKAMISGEETYLEFEDARLETGFMHEEELSPMQCIPSVLNYIQNGYISEYASEKIGEEDCLRLRFSDPNQMMGSGQEAILWINKESGNFAKSEMLFDGVVKIFCEFNSFEKV